MQKLNTVNFQHLQDFHREVSRLFANVLVVCVRFRYSEGVYDYTGYGEEIAKIDIDPKTSMGPQATRLAELQKQLAELKASGEFLAWLTPTEWLPFTQELWKYRASNLATRFLLSQGDRPRGYHEIALDLATGCLDELRNLLDDPQAAANAGESWEVAFTMVGGSQPQWQLHLQAEMARARDPDTGLTEEEKRQKFAFDAWEAGWSHKQINCHLQKNSSLGGLDWDRSVRSLINAWSRRIGAEPRKGQPARAVHE